MTDREIQIFDVSAKRLSFLNGRLSLLAAPLSECERSLLVISFSDHMFLRDVSDGNGEW